MTPGLPSDFCGFSILDLGSVFPKLNVHQVSNPEFSAVTAEETHPHEPLLPFVSAQDPSSRRSSNPHKHVLLDPNPTLREISRGQDECG